MSTTRRFFLKKAVSATGGLVAVTLFPRTGFAGCTSNTMSLNFNDEGIVTIPDWKVGDCELKQATLRISGNYIILNSLVCTHHTHTKDVWHMTVELITRDAANPTQVIVLGTGHLNGPKMSELDKPLFHVWNDRFGFNPQVAKGRRFAARITSCC